MMEKTRWNMVESASANQKSESSKKSRGCSFLCVWEKCVKCRNYYKQEGVPVVNICTECRHRFCSDCGREKKSGFRDRIKLTPKFILLRKCKSTAKQRCIKDVTLLLETTSFIDPEKNVTTSEEEETNIS